MEMTETKLQLLKDSIRGLESGELDQLVDYCLLQKQASNPTHDRSGLLFYHAIEFTLRKIGHRLPPLPVFQKQAAGKGFATQVCKVETFLKELIGSKPSTWDRTKAYQLLVGLLAEDVQRLTIPLSPKTLLEAVDRLPSVFEDAFPGYIASGLAGRILQKNS